MIDLMTFPDQTMTKNDIALNPNTKNTPCDPQPQKPKQKNEW